MAQAEIYEAPLVNSVTQEVPDVAPPEEMDYIFIPKEPSYPWGRNATCKRLDPEIFVERNPTGRRPLRSREDLNADARAYCASCIVRLECLTSAIATPVEGIWGGLVKSERDRLKRAIGRNGLGITLLPEVATDLTSGIRLATSEHREELYDRLTDIARPHDVQNSTKNEDFRGKLLHLLRESEGRYDTPNGSVLDEICGKLQAGKSTASHIFLQLQTEGVVKLVRGRKMRITSLVLLDQSELSATA